MRSPVSAQLAKLVAANTKQHIDNQAAEDAANALELAQAQAANSVRAYAIAELETVKALEGKQVYDAAANILYTSDGVKLIKTTPIPIDSEVDIPLVDIDNDGVFDNATVDVTPADPAPSPFGE